MWSTFYSTYTRAYPRLPQATRNKWAYHMSGVPFYGSGIRAQDMMNYMNDYMSNRGIGWDDLKYPSITPGAGSAVSAISSVAGGVLFTSSNLARFYGRGYVPDRGYSGYEYL